jgi:hypothetical protein
MGVDPNNQPIAVVNELVNYGWDYVWHCHLLGHEENDMMRPIIFAVAPKTPDQLTATASQGGTRVNLTWRDNSANEANFTLQRASDSAFVTNLTTFTVNGSNPASQYGGIISYADNNIQNNTTYYYRVIANDTVGYTTGAAAGYPTASTTSFPSNVAVVDGPKLAFTQQPVGGSVSNPLTTQPTVAIQSPTGNTITTDQSTKITLSVTGGSATLTCTGGTTQTVVNGHASFSGCKVSAAGIYTLQATAATSNSFTVFAQGSNVAWQQTVTSLNNGTFCFTYTGPTTQVAGFATLFAPTVSSVNIRKTQAGYWSWNRSAPQLATATSITSVQTACVSAPIGSQVFP